MLQPDQVISGRYRVDRMIGGGGSADVYKVEHVRLKSMHALKVLHDASGPEVTQALLLEGRVQAMLAHPNIVRVVDILDLGDADALIMDFVDGETLAEWLAGDGKSSSLIDLLGVFVGVIRGVNAAHVRGIIHRDLNPTNILLSVTGGRVTAKIADFGRARLTGESATLVAPPVYRMVGVPRYTSPEQADDPGLADERSDLFSLGCILYEMICGAPAFVGSSREEIEHLVQNGLHEPPTSHVPNLSAPLQRVVRSLLTTDRNRRLANCKSLFRALELRD